MRMLSCLIWIQNAEPSIEKENLQPLLAVCMAVAAGARTLKDLHAPCPK